MIVNDHISKNLNDVREGDVLSQRPVTRATSELSDCRATRTFLLSNEWNWNFILVHITDVKVDLFTQNLTKCGVRWSPYLWSSTYWLLGPTAHFIRVVHHSRIKVFIGSGHCHNCRLPYTQIFLMYTMYNMSHNIRIHNTYFDAIMLLLFFMSMW
jgi:hypothetical protein